MKMFWSTLHCKSGEIMGNRSSCNFLDMHNILGNRRLCIGNRWNHFKLLRAHHHKGISKLNLECFVFDFW